MLDKTGAARYNICCTFLRAEVCAVLNLTGVFAGEGSLPFAFSLDLSDLDFYGQHPFAQPVQVAGTVENQAGIVTLRATASFVYAAPCDRCGTPVERRYDLPFTHTVVTELQSPEEDDGYVLAPDQQLDAETLLRDDVVLWVPLKFLCRPDCKGLCDQCGHNLNDGPCACRREPADPRLAALQSLLKQD